eukprot:CAMPEP_0113629664 /NCGR_PEP_ID=MMETSP0017_2-20120614/15403_1 /TAXON_ID=2856 /ORGANISM="Cylindrotheca closterium" /LENGTH=223 /DNA_ID=CAMNT_0000540079 /DNA_START=52 /DNA_END=723 /DNA_ORIENTATION=+ /assembly_acc=CAM_ASM_000147
MCKSTVYTSTKDRVVLKSLSTNIPSMRKRTFRQRKVCFSFEKENPAAAPSPVKEITLDHITNVWYSKGEIRSFKTQAKSLILRGLPSNEETFGMERYQLERSRTKKNTVKYVVLSQKVKSDPEFQSYISRRNSSTAKEFALDQALENFCEVYDPLSSLLEGGDNYNEFFFANNNTNETPNGKRSISDVSFNMNVIDQTSSQEEDVVEQPLRRVRQRTIAAMAC